MAKTKMSHVREESMVTFYFNGGGSISGEVLSLPSVHSLWVIERFNQAGMKKHLAYVSQFDYMTVDSR